MNDRFRYALATITVSLAALGCNADRPELTDASGGGLPCSPFADLLVAFTPGTGGPSEAGASALGAPDGDVVAVGVDASLTVAFVGAGAFTDGASDDVQIHATASADAQAIAYVSADGASFEFAGDLGPDNLLIDLATASASAVTEVRVVGVAGEVAIDAVEALTIDCNLE